MKKPLPYRWLQEDYPEIGTMTHDQHSCFRLLWDACWRLNGLPASIEELARLCHNYPLPEFKKQVWCKLEDFFVKSGDSLFLPDLQEQIKASKRLSKFQSIRSKARKLKRLDTIPADIPKLSEEKPLVPIIKNYVKPELPSDSPKEPEYDPADFEEPQNQNPEPIQNPVEIRTESDGNPTDKNVPHETTEEIYVNHNLHNEIELNFNQDHFWTQLVWIWPGRLKEDARALFDKEIRSRSQWHELRRRASEYKRRLPLNQEPENFTDWFWK